ncbi:chorismate mutase [Parafrankia colletiae]|uniref:Chorismate mutase n=1 Tax=Parafrankia colletiae TaxID=573497 RepID=A0A1S1RI64_9ACTN|nr:chorismate mutase [Parafrankia colletiae]MCK9904555.1 chorismate mutase [Frankia sp. Cpl3]OHV46413.1 chorismate mutase [Parafrankia colletiae]
MTDAGNVLRDIRSRIDLLDQQIVQLLAAREDLVRAAGRLKSDTAAVRAPDRVEQVVQRVRGLAKEAGASPEVVDRIYRAMISAFIDLELAVHRADRHPG